jgi:hypothetical protein
MVRSTKGRLKNIFIVSLALLLNECANQLPPDGGAVDTTPPTIIEVYPQDGTTNFNDDYFELGFSEYVEKRSVKDAIFISPAIEGDLELDWSGKYVRVYFPDSLQQNKTYVITIGTDVEDFNNRNKMSETFSFTFSTGPKIDRKVISGRIYDKKPQGVMLFGYLMQGQEPNPLENKPDYISQSGIDGIYKLAGLAAGTYRIFAIRDEFRDLLFHPDQDEIGIPYKDIELSEFDTLYTGVNFILTSIDTVKPRLLSASMTDRSHILVNFSEELDWEFLKAFNFHLIDSTLKKRIQVRYAFKGNTKASEYVLVPSEISSVENTVYLFSDSIKDKSGNIFYNDFVPLTLSDRIDTTKTGLDKASPPPGSRYVDFLFPKFTFEFNDAFNIVEVREGVTFSDTLKKNVPFEIEFIDDASFRITPLKRLDMSKDYVITIDLSRLKDASGNYYDSVYQYRFKTISGLEFTGVSGRIFELNEQKNPKIEIRNVENDKIHYSTLISSNGQFNFERVLPGKYLLFSFYDLDSNNVYSKGQPFPFKPSEEFSFYRDTLNLRARWIETDIRFNFKDK